MEANSCATVSASGSSSSRSCLTERKMMSSQASTCQSWALPAQCDTRSASQRSIWWLHQSPLRGSSSSKNSVSSSFCGDTKTRTSLPQNLGSAVSCYLNYRNFPQQAPQYCVYFRRVGLWRIRGENSRHLWTFCWCKCLSLFLSVFFSILSEWRRCLNECFVFVLFRIDAMAVTAAIGRFTLVLMTLTRSKRFRTGTARGTCD